MSNNRCIFCNSLLTFGVIENENKRICPHCLGDMNDPDAVKKATLVVEEKTQKRRVKRNKKR